MILNARDLGKRKKLFKFRDWDCNATQICLRNKRAVFINNNRMSYIDMDLTSEISAVVHSTHKKCSRFTWQDKYLLALSSPETLSIWDFDGNLPSAGACLIEKQKLPESDLDSDANFKLYVNSFRALVSFDGSTWYSFKMQIPESSFELDGTKSVVFSAGEREQLL